MAASCIYPFDAELPSYIAETLVVDGDILAGEMTTVRLSYLTPIGMKDSGKEVMASEVSVIDDLGKVYSGVNSGRSVYTLDTRNTGSATSFKLRISLSEPEKDYETGWIKLNEAPSATDLKYVCNQETVNIVAAFKGSGSKYYRADFTEAWEFHADFIPSCLFDPQSKSRTAPFKPFPEDADPMANYYCWSSGISREARLATTDALAEDRVEGFVVNSIRRSDRKISVLYYIEVSLRGLSRGGYEFLNNLNVNSNNAGSLFSPVPSDILGNIRCVADTTEKVIGYIEASRVTKAHIYLDNGKLLLFTGSYGDEYLLSKPEPDEDGNIDFLQYYQSGYRPVGQFTINGESAVFWAPLRCVDCTAAGGSKVKPAGWPNDHI